MSVFFESTSLLALNTSHSPHSFRQIQKNLFPKRVRSPRRLFLPLFLDFPSTQSMQTRNKRRRNWKTGRSSDWSNLHDSDRVRGSDCATVCVCLSLCERIPQCGFTQFWGGNLTTAVHTQNISHRTQCTRGGEQNNGSSSSSYTLFPDVTATWNSPNDAENHLFSNLNALKGGKTQHCWKLPMIFHLDSKNMML